MSNNMDTSWYDITPGSLNLPDAQSFEPSGLTLYSDGGDPWIFAVGDSGMVIKAKINHSREGDPGQTSWIGPDTIPASDVPVSPNDSNLKPNDFECVSFAGGNVMIGVEGDRTSGSDPTPTVPHLVRFDQDKTNSSHAVGDFTGSSWDLDDLLPSDAKPNAGMEALTFIPSGYFPSAWSGGGHYGGVFLAATQSSGQQARVYDLAQGSNAQGQPREDIASTAVAVSESGLSAGVLTIPSPSTAVDADGNPLVPAPLISELFFDTSRSTLWVLYDGGTKKDYLQALALSSSTGELTESWSDVAPWVGLEGMAVDGDDVYLSIDNNDSSDGVYVLSGFASTVLPSS